MVMLQTIRVFLFFLSCFVSSVHHKVTSALSAGRMSGDRGNGSGEVMHFSGDDAPGTPLIYLVLSPPFTTIKYTVFFLLVK